MTLLSLLIPLIPEEPTTLPAYLGRETHAWFLDRVTALDHHLARRLHTANAPRPFTVSNLLGGDRRWGDTRHVQPEAQVALRLTSYEPELSAFIQEALLPNLPERVFLAGVPFRRGAAIRRPEETDVRAWQNWVGESSFETLVARHTLQPEIPPRFSLHFASPTVFKSRKAYVPLPLPGLLVQSLVRRWNAVAQLQLHPDIVRFAEEHVLISSYRLHTEAVRFSKSEQKGVVPGFVGVCRYAIRRQDRYWMGLLHTLAAFAFYAGVGKQTAMGFGQARLLEPAEH
ncbi:MAG: CRISPR-associated endoribonuclease Cas6 [Chloroflexi bacterium]|nr:CRISPR-associated endoribonuclease Cas6 [Chloroflexota bacterium]